MDYDLQNRIQCRRSFAWDTTLAQFKIYQIDSNFQYDLVFTTLATDQIQYTFTTGSQQPYSRQMVQFPGTSSYESTQTYLQYNLNQQQWENVNRFRFTAQSCNNIDTTFVEYWNTTSLAWDLSSGTKHIFNWIDSCDFNESIVQTFVPYLSIFRNYGKWVYPYSATTSIEDKTGNNKVSIFPNPFHTQAQLETNLDITSHNYILKIYNILGTLIREEEILNLNSYILHRDALNDGLYFYELRTTGYELIGSGKFVIN